MKKIIFILTIATLLFACKKKDSTPEIIIPTNYDEIKMSDIVAMENTLTNFTSTVASSNDGIIWKRNDVYIFKTNEGRFGKFKVNDIIASDYSMNIIATVYNADGSIKASTNTSFVNIRKNYLCDLDKLLEVTVGNGEDFWLKGFTGNPTVTIQFLFQSSAKFVKYTF
jgi:hypothetical protein